MPQRTPKPWPAPRPAIVRSAFGAYANSPSSHFVPLDWHPTDYELTDGQNWPEFPGNKNAKSWWPRGWKTAGLVAIRAAYIQDLEDTLRHPNAVPGVATLSLQNKIWAGELPHGFGRMEHRGEEHVSVAGRIGPGALRIMPVLIDRDTSELLVPRVDPSEIIQFGPVHFEPDLSPAFGTTPVV